ncbi:MAG: Hpt domain-containing protein [Hyphomonadaceae bacterium]|nr:Hpt domain-containing protein [Hyphomonadaceae bacterium]
MAKPSVQLIDPKQFGRKQLSHPVFDADSVARAERALTALRGSFQDWLEADVALLQAARIAGQERGWNDNTFDALLNAAHDLKGLGATYEYPLATKMAASLCRLLEAEEGRTAMRKAPDLLIAHVDAIRAAARDHIKSTESPVGRALLQALVAEVDALGIGAES